MIDILPAANGEDSYGVGCWSDLFGGFLPQPPLFQRRTTKRLHFWPCPAIGLVDARILERTAGKNKGPYILGLNAEALRPRFGKFLQVKLRGIGQSLYHKTIQRLIRGRVAVVSVSSQRTIRGAFQRTAL